MNRKRRLCQHYMDLVLVLHPLNMTYESTHRHSRESGNPWVGERDSICCDRLINAKITWAPY